MFAALGVKVTADRAARPDRRLPRPRDLRGAPAGDGGAGHPDAPCQRRGRLGPQRAGHRAPPEVRGQSSPATPSWSPRGGTATPASWAWRRSGSPLGKRGLLPVNEHYQTAVPHIYAAGDVIGVPALASTSMEQARVAMVHAFDLKYKKTWPRPALRDLHDPRMLDGRRHRGAADRAEGPLHRRPGRRTPPTPAGRSSATTTGSSSSSSGPSDMKLLGVHVIGEQATELVHVGLTALLMDADADLFINSCYNYPTLSDLYKYATYDALGRRAMMSQRRRAGAPEPGGRGPPPRRSGREVHSFVMPIRHVRLDRRRPDCPGPAARLACASTGGRRPRAPGDRDPRRSGVSPFRGVPSWA